MRGRQAVQRLLQQVFTQVAPGHEWRLHAVFSGVRVANGVAVSSVVQLREAGVKQLGPTRVEVVLQQIGGAALIWMKK